VKWLILGVGTGWKVAASLLAKRTMLAGVPLIAAPAR